MRALDADVTGVVVTHSPGLFGRSAAVAEKQKSKLTARYPTYNKFPKEHKVKLFRVVVSDNRTDWVITNGLPQNSTGDTQKVCAIRWKIEQFHRELKQVTGVDKCQRRKARIQRNHIASAVLVWIRLTELARKSMTTIYAIKRGLLTEYLKLELRSPSVRLSSSESKSHEFLHAEVKLAFA